MPKRTYEEDFVYIEKSADINFKYINEMKSILDDILKNEKYEAIDFFNEFPHKKDFIMTGEVYKMQTACLIIKNELQFCGNVFFANSSSTADTVIEKINYLTLMLRRIEIEPQDEFADKAYEYIEKENISIEAIITVLKRGAFELEKEVCTNLYLKYEKTMDIGKKLEWLYLIGETYKDTLILIRLANIQMELKQYIQACETLNKIQEPSQSIRSLIAELETIANE